MRYGENDAPASSAEPETAIPRSLIALLKGIKNILVKIAPADTPNEYNIELTNADTEYSRALPDGTKGIEFTSRNGYPVSFAFTSGKVANHVSPYNTLKSNCSHSETGLYLRSATIYFATSHAGDVIELIAWS